MSRETLVESLTHDLCRSSESESSDLKLSLFMPEAANVS